MAGRPKIIWSDKDKATFEGLCKIQCTKDEIASVMQIHPETIDRLVLDHFGIDYPTAYKKFAGAGKASLRRTQFELAKRNAAMAIWLGKQYLGQRDIDIQQDAENKAALRELVDGFGKSME